MKIGMFELTVLEIVGEVGDDVPNLNHLKAPLGWGGEFIFSPQLSKEMGRQLAARDLELKGEILPLLVKGEIYFPLNDENYMRFAAWDPESEEVTFWELLAPYEALSPWEPPKYQSWFKF